MQIILYYVIYNIILYYLKNFKVIHFYVKTISLILDLHTKINIYFYENYSNCYYIQYIIGNRFGLEMINA